MRIAVIGTGHVGLVSGACFSAKGHQVVCVDIDPGRVQAINEGRVPFFEAGLEKLVQQQLTQGLRASLDLPAAVAEADVILLAVGTPFDGRRLDLSHIETAARQVGEALRDHSGEALRDHSGEALRDHSGEALRDHSGEALRDHSGEALRDHSGEALRDHSGEALRDHSGEALRDHDGAPLVLVKSTVLPGTTDGLVREQLEAGSGRKAGEGFHLGMNPEFLREGQAVSDFMVPDRIVLGGSDDRSHEIQAELYRDFPCSDVIRTDNSTAEMIKYTSNSLLATLISFSNEIGNLCATLPGVDVREVMSGVHLDKRLAPILDQGAESGERIHPGILSYLAAGCGFGGSCLPKDVQSLIAFGEDRGSSMDILDSVIQLNRRQPEHTLSLIRRHFPDLSGLPVAILGLAFKPGTSDIRESPALPVIRSLLEDGADLRAYDPAALDNTRAALGPELSSAVRFTDDLARAVDGAAAAVILTSWPQLKTLPELLEPMDSPPLVIDGRRMLDPESVPRYEGIGRGPSPGRS